MNIYVSEKLKNKERYLDGISYSTLKDAINDLNDNDVILLENEIYYGKIIIKNDNIKIYGKDRTIITYDAYHGLEVRDCDKKDVLSETYGTTGSASVLIEGNNFYAYNIIFQNSHKRVVGEIDGQAVALKVTGDNSMFVECKFISQQDTLYIDTQITARLERCYIEGDVDFIFGSGNAIFNNCDIYSRKNDKEISYICAPSTLKENEYGFMFYDCKIFSEGAKAYLSRPWYPAGALRYPKVCYINCYFDKHIILEEIKMKQTDPSNSILIYNNCIQNDEIVENDGSVLKYLKFV